MAQPRILIVEDHPLMADALRVHLKNMVPQVVCVQAGHLKDALTCLQTQQYALVLLDLNLPDSHGIHTLNAVCVVRESGPLAVLSAVDDEEIAQACLASNVVYLRKSVQASQLMSELLSLLATVLVPIAALAPNPEVEDSSLQQIKHLSKKQRLVLAQMAQGKSTEALAQALGISQATVRSHMAEIYKRLGVQNRTQASTRYVLWTQQQGLVDE